MHSLCMPQKRPSKAGHEFLNSNYTTVMPPLKRSSIWYTTWASAHLCQGHCRTIKVTLTRRRGQPLRMDDGGSRLSSSGVEDWLEELEREDLLAQEYIASVIDSYYGLWAAWDEDEGGMWGIWRLPKPAVRWRPTTQRGTACFGDFTRVHSHPFVLHP